MGAEYNSANAEEPFSFTTCCTCNEGYVQSPDGQSCVQRTCGNEDGAGNALECGAGMTIKAATAQSTTVTVGNCCSCATGFLFDAVRSRYPGSLRFR